MRSSALHKEIDTGAGGGGSSLYSALKRVKEVGPLITGLGALRPDALRWRIMNFPDVVISLRATVYRLSELILAASWRDSATLHCICIRSGLTCVQGTNITFYISFAILY